jgi:predicted permease
VAAGLLGLDGRALLAVAITSALPTAQNVFTHANRYGRARVLARDTILVTTVLCLPVMLLIAAVLG